jgi:hypothetical protein
MANSEEAKRIIQSERRKLQRQASSFAKERMDQARRSLRDAESTKMDSAKTNNDEAIFRGLLGLVRATETTWNIDAPISLERTWDKQIQAVTDFQTIQIKYPDSMIPAKVGDFNVDHLRLFISDVKGLAYHEIGHIRFTTPYPVLWDLVYPGDNPVPEYHHTWNVLEDQRMEAAVVADSPNIAGYFTTMILKHMLSNTRGRDTRRDSMQWLLLVGRRYLPSDIRKELRRAFIQEFGKHSTMRADQIVGDYMCATTPKEMLDAVVAFHSLIQTLGPSAPQGIDTHRAYVPGGPPSRNGGAGAEEAGNQIQKSASDTPVDNEGLDDSIESTGASEYGEEEGNEEANRGQDAAEGGDKEDNKAESSLPSAGDKPNQNGDTQKPMPQTAPPAPGSPGGHGTANKTLSERVQDNIDAFNESLKSDKSINETIRSIHEYANSRTSSLPSYRSISTQTSDLVSEADEAASAMIQALTYYTAESAPMWQSHQRRGVLDPFVYRTRQPGDMEYRRQYDDRGGDSIDIAITVMLDVSGSMGGNEYNLGAVAYTCKKACEALDIPCTVCTFEDGGYVLWTPEDRAEHLSILMGGGTNPIQVCDALDEQSYDKGNHLVLVMTDGAFNNSFNGFQHYGADGRYFIGFGYGGYYSTASLESNKVHEAYAINNLMDIPKALTGFLSAFLR